jgi:predicted 3-demethylubiquinone-9 3-methyltransferase (glyoxalase superfamily)
MPTITTFLTYTHGAEEAARFYTSIFPGSRIVDTVLYPEGAPSPAGSVMTVTFELLGRRYVALNGGPSFRFSDGISLAVECADQAEVDLYWSKLTEGGTEGPCGWLKDKFGVSWQVNPKGVEELLFDPKALALFFTMKKLDIDALRRAARG